MLTSVLSTMTWIPSPFPCSLIHPCLSILSDRLRSPLPPSQKFTSSMLSWTTGPIDHLSAFRHRASPPPFTVLPSQFQQISVLRQCSKRANHLIPTRGAHNPASNLASASRAARVPSISYALTAISVSTTFFFLSISSISTFFLAPKTRYNWKKHLETHDPNRIRPFMCPESDCRLSFTRKHDRERHLKLHGDQEK